MKKKVLHMFLSQLLVMTAISSAIPGIVPVAKAASTTNTATEDYGLAQNVQDGVTLQCWNWSYNNITKNMEKIASLGYTSIQTSPIQTCKEATVGKKQGSSWWLYYQPSNFTIDNTGNSALGTKAEFEKMCDEAHKYGIKVIVDVVSNHLGNQTGNDLSSAIPSDIRNDGNCWHNIKIDTQNYNDRYDVTQHCMAGLPDLNTGNSKVQNYVLNFLKECIDSGADGFRFDAAKHIETPDDYGFASNFWPYVINGATDYASATRGIDLYCYGEVLDAPGGNLSINSYTKYMSVTDNQTGNNLRNYVNNGNAGGAGSSYYAKGSAADTLVLWAESHDTYSNKESSGVSTHNINKAWAIAAARSDAMGLYFARPSDYNTLLGTADTTGWAYDEVGEINDFHNEFIGTTEYMDYEGSIAYCERGTSGVVLVNCSGNSTYVNVAANKIADGTYKDQITGSTFTVSGGRITGNMGGTGIAVVYNEQDNPSITCSKEGGNFSEDTLTVSLGLKNADSGTYQIGNGNVVNFTGNTTFTIGEDMNTGDSVTVTVTAKKGSVSKTFSYTYTKVDTASNIAYISVPDNWSTNLYCYAYSADNENVRNAAWPGVAMTKVSSNVYSYEVPENITNPLVIFTDGNNQYPGANQQGLSLSGSMIYEDGKWEAYTETPVKANIAYIEKLSGWNSNLYCYVYSADNENVRNAAWPGVAMTQVSSNIYSYEVPENITNPLVIFTDGYNQYPGANQKGLSLSGSMIYSNGSWSNYSN